MSLRASVQLVRGVALLLLAACAASREHDRALPSELSTAVWRTHDARRTGPENFVPPELELLPEIQRKENLGIAVSGGGSRSAVAALGQFRALKKLGLLDRARFISSDSGGTWLCAPFVFARPSLLPANDDHPNAETMRRMTQAEYDRVFLGEYLPPNQLTEAQFQNAPEGSYVRAIAEVDMKVSALFQGYGTESYARIVSGAFLKPFGLGEPDKSFTWSADWFARSIAPHQSGSLTQDDFYFAAPGRPYLIISQAVTLPHRISVLDRAESFIRNLFTPEPAPDCQAFYPVETTPIYTGMRPFAAPNRNHRMFGRRDKPAGGGFVETFAYGSRFDRWEAESHESRAIVKPAPQSHGLPPTLFSLGNATGNSGAAVAAVLGGAARLGNLEPQHWCWPPSNRHPESDEQHLPHVDGGACDNSGVIPLLARHTDRVVCLVDSIFRFPENGGRGEIAPWDIPTDVTALFGAPGSTMLLNMIGEPSANEVLERELPDGRDALSDLAQELSERNKTGRPMVVCREYVTVNNARHAIQGGQRVKICWVFLGFTRLGDKHRSELRMGPTIVGRWIAKLPPDSQPWFTDKKNLQKFGLKNFPAFDIVKENPRTQQLTPLQANALSQFTAFCLLEEGTRIRKFLER